MVPQLPSLPRMADEGDDFVFTLPDEDDEDSASGKGGESDTPNLELRGLDIKQGKKRKRVDGVTHANGNGDVKERKKARVVKEMANGQDVNRKRRKGRDSEEEDQEVEAEAGEDDDALDPGFEFEIPGFGEQGTVEDFDVWADGGHLGDGADAGGDKRNGASQSRKGVGVDEIVARRRAAKLNSKGDDVHDERMSADESDEVDGDEEQGGGSEEEDDEGQEDLEIPDFKDDELLALDGFGAGADPSEDEVFGGNDGERENLQDGSGSGSESNDDDADSVASPTAHPDDMADSDSGSAESIEDAEERSKRAAFFAPESDTTKSKPGHDLPDPSSFQSFSLSRPVIKGLSAIAFTKPTAIQRKTIPVALLGQDVVGSAVTGSGKTAAFLLPIIERLLYRPRKIPTTRVAILMPTRELAVQCYAFAVKLAHFTDITFAQLVGGFSLREQEAVLKSRPDIVIATPGRFIDHMRNSAAFTIDTLEILVLDEADRMLEDGFADELNEIISSIPKSRQTMLFSATMTDNVDKLIRVGMNRPVRLMVDKQKSTVGTLTQEFVRLRPGREDKREGYLLYLVKNVHMSRAIIFFRQRKDAHRIRILFSLLDLKAGELHGAMSQEQRISAVESFRSNRTTFLLATDLASRGLDIKGVETVINYEAPQSHELYVHRVGRTARAGRTGRACTLAAEPDRRVVKSAVKAARSQGAKIVSRTIDTADADAWSDRAADLATEIEEVLREEKEEKQLAQVDRDVSRASNLVEHRDEIMSRPRRTWFTTEREKKAAAAAAGAAAGRPIKNGTTGDKKAKLKLSGKEKKRLDDKRERKGIETIPGGGGEAQSKSKSKSKSTYRKEAEAGPSAGKLWRKGKGSEEAVERERRERKKKKSATTSGGGGGKKKPTTKFKPNTKPNAKSNSKSKSKPKR